MRRASTPFTPLPQVDLVDFCTLEKSYSTSPDSKKPTLTLGERDIQDISSYFVGTVILSKIVEKLTF